MAIRSTCTPWLRSLLFLGLGLIAGRQLRIATPPADAAALPPVQDPWATTVERRDLIQEFAPASPVEGFYELERSFTPGVGESTAVRGYLFFARRHMQLHIVQPGTRRVPYVQSGVRSYVLRGEELLTTTLVGHTTDRSGKVILDPPGVLERRRVVITGNRLRVEQEDGSYLDFVRAE